MWWASSRQMPPLRHRCRRSAFASKRCGLRARRHQRARRESPKQQGASAGNYNILDHREDSSLSSHSPAHRPSPSPVAHLSFARLALRSPPFARIAHCLCIRMFDSEWLRALAPTPRLPVRHACECGLVCAHIEACKMWVCVRAGGTVLQVRKGVRLCAFIMLARRVSVCPDWAMCAFSAHYAWVWSVCARVPLLVANVSVCLCKIACLCGRVWAWRGRCGTQLEPLTLRGDSVSATHAAGRRVCITVSTLLFVYLPQPRPSHCRRIRA